MRNFQWERIVMAVAAARAAEELLALAAPVVIAELGWVAMQIVDTLMVGRLGPDAIGAVGLASSLFIAVGVFAMGLLLGLDPLVAQAFGASRQALEALRVGASAFASDLNPIAVLQNKGTTALSIGAADVVLLDANEKTMPRLGKTDVTVEPVPLRSRDEVGQVARAFADAPRDVPAVIPPQFGEPLLLAVGGGVPYPGHDQRVLQAWIVGRRHGLHPQRGVR